ncbi:peptidoglycan-binding domain-containing protein [Actinoplanes sp. NPDC049118]|uniref:peptidoglycan-binding domain-containing protein n=1 Tax=Actinoplanes sp. NPDC049118 TaxID=3155769 RepID=UPI00340810F8
MAPNPNPARITDAMWWLWEQLHALEPRDTELGGIYARKPGYHNTRAGNAANNYSVRDAVDKRGPADKAAALDWTFKSAQRGDYRTIAKYMSRIIASGRDKRDPRLDGWRDIYGQADKDRHVEGWDCRYDRDITSDDSHLWHIHFSESRERVTSRANKDALLSVLKGESLDAWLKRTGAKPKPPAPKGTWCKGAYRPELRRGSAGEHVKFLQAMIGSPVDGDFGPATEARVRWYQKLRGIAVDGIAGRRTWTEINKM